MPAPGTVDANGKRRSLRTTLRRYMAALALADDTIVESRECVAGQRQDYQTYQVK